MSLVLSNIRKTFTRRKAQLFTEKDGQILQGTLCNYQGLTTGQSLNSNGNRLYVGLSGTIAPNGSVSYNRVINAWIEASTVNTNVTAPVRVRYSRAEKVWYVIGMDAVRLQQGGASIQRYNYDSANNRFIDSGFILDFLSRPVISAGNVTEVFVKPGVLYWNGSRYEYDGGKVDLSAYAAATSGNHLIAQLWYNPTDNDIEVTTSTQQTIATAFDSTDWAETLVGSNSWIPLQSYELFDDSDVSITHANLLRDNRPIYSLAGRIKVNLSATTAPTVNNDVDEGYVVSSRWFDTTNDKEYVCLDNTDGAAVWIETTQSGGDSKDLFVATADKTVANTTTETSLFGTGEGSLILPANYLVAGRAIHIAMRGRLGDTGTPTLNLQLKLGSTVIASTGATALTGVSDVEWQLDLMLTCRSTGASGVVVGGGLFDYDDGTEISLSSASNISVDTTGSLALDVTMTWGAADASNTITAREAMVEMIDPNVLAALGGLGGSTGSTDNAILRANGTGGDTIQASGITIDDSDTLEMTDNVISRAELLDYSETLVIDTDSGTTHTIDLTTGNHHSLTLTDDCTLTFSNPSPTGKACSFTLRVIQDGTGGHVLTYPASVDWAGGSAPTLTATANATDFLTFLTYDAGTTWYGFVGGLNFS